MEKYALAIGFSIFFGLTFAALAMMIFYYPDVLMEWYERFS